MLELFLSLITVSKINITKTYVFDTEMMVKCFAILQLWELWWSMNKNICQTELLMHEQYNQKNT